MVGCARVCAHTAWRRRERRRRFVAAAGSRGLGLRDALRGPQDAPSSIADARRAARRTLRQCLLPPAQACCGGVSARASTLVSGLWCDAVTACLVRLRECLLLHAREAQQTGNARTHETRHAPMQSSAHSRTAPPHDGPAQTDRRDGFGVALLTALICKTGTSHNGCACRADRAHRGIAASAHGHVVNFC